MANGAPNEPGTHYSLTFVNQSTQSGSVCIYQQDPDLSSANPLSLAWFTKFTHPGTMAEFEWDVRYNFVWGETGELVPGVRFRASQILDANLTTENQVTFTHTDGAYKFENLGQGPRENTLFIDESSTIPPNQASVGIGMSGFGTFVVQAQPNTHLNFTPHPQYWIAFGDYMRGEVLEIAKINNPAQIPFQPNQLAITATLTAENKWEFKPTPQVNAEFLQARKQDPELTWSRHAGALPSPRG